MKRFIRIFIIFVVITMLLEAHYVSGQDSSGSSEVRKAASRVIAVADEQTNSLVVSAPDEMMPLIESLINEIDSVGDTITEVRVFPLHYSNAEEMAGVINNVFKEQTQTSQQSRWSRFRPPQPQQQQQSQRQIEEITVTAVADIRTNSVIVKAASETMAFIEQMVKALDSDPAKDRKVFIYNLENADAEKVQEVLQNMFKQQGSSSTRTTTTRNTTRQNTGQTNRQSSSNTQSGNTRNQ